MRTSLSQLAVLGVASLVSVDAAEACSCMFPDIAWSYRTHDHAFVGKAISKRRAAGYVLYEVAVIDTAKSCLPVGRRIIVSTPPNQAACGTVLPLNTPLVLFGDTKLINGQRTVFTTLCSGDLLANSLSAFDEDFLLSREVTCGGVSECADGSLPVSCVVSPCDGATCSDPTAICEDNYCGGCNAEWYTPDDYLACMPW